MKKISMIIAAALISLSAVAQSVALKSEGRDEAYVKNILGRSEKNISKLNLTGEKAEAVRNIVANRYFELNDIYSERDSKLKFAKDSLKGDCKKKAIDAANAQCEAQLYRTHFAFPAALSIYLTEDEVTAIKDAMTYNVVKVTYDATLDMIPSLKEEEKVQILVWLKEAREYAMDAENSNKKHGWFGKYKGRINNYLSKRGYDLTKEREEWYKRIEERKAKK